MLNDEDRKLIKEGKKIKSDYDHLRLCEVCVIKDQSKMEALLRRIDRIAKLEAFLSGLARIALLDWGKVSDKLKNEVSLEAIASGLNIIERETIIGFIDKNIHDEMERQKTIIGS